MLSALKDEANMTCTENGALANRSTGSCCLEFFSDCGALRCASPDDQLLLFLRAYAEDKTLAMRALFYARDIRQGLGERTLFRRILKWLANCRPLSVVKNIPYLPEYGRWDDILTLLDTPCESAAVQCIRDQLQRDLDALEAGAGVSLLAKWLPSVNASSPLTKRRARLLCKQLHMSEKEYRQTLSRLRARLDVLERRLCRRDYTFDYSKQPSTAMHKYAEAFLRNDALRYRTFLIDVRSGKKTMHAGTLYPYQIVEKCLAFDDQDDPPDPDLVLSLDAAWKSLPDYCDRRNALAVIDGSGSMYCTSGPRPIDVAMSLGIYFAERNTGYFKNHFITFSQTPQLVELKGDNIVDRALYCATYCECQNTNLRATFELVLDAALRHHIPQEEMPETLYIISDMEFDEGVDHNVTLFDELKALYTRNGYRLPALVYWRVARRRVQYPVTRDENGTVMVSGASPVLFRMVISQNADPESFMRAVLNGERYACITG